MFEALSIGATGMQAQQLSVETIANNLANANTLAFKKGRVDFSNVLSTTAAQAVSGGDESRAADALAVQRLGAGVGVGALTRMFDNGDLKKTESPLDIAINGDGFLEVLMPDGGSAYTRGGSLKVKDGLLVTQAGYPLKPSIAVPDNATAIVITADGRVQLTLPNQHAPVDAGQLELVRFPNPGGLLAVGDNLYRSTDAAGDALTTRAGDGGAGTIAQGFVEASNVKMVDEMVNLMLAQRAYEASVKVVQAADEMLGMVNNLRK